MSNCDSSDNRHLDTNNIKFILNLKKKQMIVLIRFKNRKAVYEHRRKKHLNPQSENQKFKCPECPREFANSNNIRRHILVAHNDLRFLCDTCGQSTFFLN